MTRLVGAVILSFILIVPYVAEAACAWVLWQENRYFFMHEMRESTAWEVPVARQTQAECEDVLRRTWEVVLRQNQPGPDKPGIEGVKSAPGIIAVTLQKQGGEFAGSVTHRFVCLPDTIDPRGAKKDDR